MENTAQEIPALASGATRNARVSFVGQLDEGELLSGTPTVTVSPTGGNPAHVAVSSPAVTTETKTINGEQVPAGKAVTFRALAGTTIRLYTFTITITTNSTPAQTLVGYARIRVKAA